MKVISLVLLLVAAFASQLPVTFADSEFEESETKLMEFAEDCLEVCLELPHIECASCVFTKSGQPALAQLLSAIATARTEQMCVDQLPPEMDTDIITDGGSRSKRRTRRPRPGTPRMARTRRPPRQRTRKPTRRPQRIRTRMRTLQTPRRRGREVHEKNSASLNKEEKDLFENNELDNHFDLFVAFIRDCSDQCSHLTSCEKKWLPCIECLAEEINPDENETAFEILKSFEA